MSVNLQVRIASLTAGAYAVIFASGLVHRFQASGSFRALAQGLAQPVVWITLLVAALVAWGLWKRYAWAWWLGMAAAGYQLFRIASSYVQGPGFGRMPGAWTLIAVTLLVLLLVLLLPRKSRLSCSR